MAYRKISTGKGLAIHLTAMRTYGLIGFPLTHSFSQKYFTEKFEKEGLKIFRYLNFSIERIDMINELIGNDSSLAGFNVTIPYKQQVISYLHELDDVSEKIGAVNTVKISRTSEGVRLKGYNTDAFGFYHSLEPLLKTRSESALILGTGGSSKAVAYALKELGINFTYVSRNPANKNILSYNDLNERVFKNCKLIINTSPAGMFPDSGAYPDIPYNLITADHVLYDLIYNPEETQFLKKGKEQGAKTINGLKMLYLQAEKSWEIWNEED